MFLKSQVACVFAMVALVTLGEERPSAKQPPESPAKVAAQVDAVVRRAMDKQRIPGLSLAVIQDGRLVVAKGYGMANVELQVPATLETVYQIQSMTKSFTATGIMMLVEEGKVGLDGKISRYLGGTPEIWKNIAVRHLLTHTSGIKDFINEPTASLRLDVTEEEVLKATALRPLNFLPGERYAYSNTNYHLLAMIIHKVTGKSYGEFLAERIFKPLGMTSTRVISLSDIVPNRAAGYQMAPGGWRNGETIASSILGYGGGGLLSTVLDMVKWDAALYTESVLKRSSLEQMWTPAALNNGKRTEYGFGWVVQTMRGHRCISHGGANVTGFRSTITRFVDDRLTVVVLANSIEVGIDRLAQKVAGIFVPDLAPPPHQPIEDKEPQIAARLKRIYADWAAGKTDEKQFTSELAKALKTAHVPELAQSFGSLQTLVLVERTAKGDLRRCRYLATFQSRQFLVTVSLNKDDLFTELRLEPE